VFLVVAVSLVALPMQADEPAATVWQLLVWKKIKSSPFARNEAATTVVEGELYLFGGFFSDLDASGQADVYDSRGVCRDGTKVLNPSHAPLLPQSLADNKRPTLTHLTAQLFAPLVVPLLISPLR